MSAAATMSDAKFSSATTTLDYIVLEPRMQVSIQQLEPLEIRLHALLLACVGLKKADALDTPLFDPTVHPWSDKRESTTRQRSTRDGHLSSLQRMPGQLSKSYQ